ncbi:pirin family protein [Pirellulaceae bacterium SH449]
MQRRQLLSVTASGLIHIATPRADLLANEGQEQIPTDLLIRRAAERGHTDLGWLKSYQSFSFGGYYDQRHMGFRSLRVINDDKITAGRGFPTHPHRDMEIISYVLTGALQHKDSTGKGAIITPTDIQMMSAGTGISHSEYNPSTTEANHFLQIWIQPALLGVRPRYLDGKLSPDEKLDNWKQIVGPEGQGGIVSVHQDANIFASRLRARKALAYTVERGRHAWLQVATGSVNVNGTQLRAGDAIATSRTANLHISAEVDSDVLLFDLV